MTSHTTDTSQHKTARTAGFLFLFTFMGPLFYGAFVFPKLTVAGNALATADNVMTNELLFRIGVVNELICSVGAIAFALVLYILLRRVNKNLASLAVLLKMTEAILLAVIALGHFIALLMLKGQSTSAVFEAGQIQALVGLFVGLYFQLGAFTMVFHGLNLMIFLYLLFRSKYVPGILAGFGIFSYAFIFIYAFITILAPGYATMLIIQILCMTPSILSELTIGFWLLIKGINVQQQDNPALESAGI